MKRGTKMVFTNRNGKMTLVVFFKKIRNDDELVEVMVAYTNGQEGGAIIRVERSRLSEVVP